MFKDAVVEIDFAGRRIAFHEPASFVAPSEAYVAPLIPAAELQSVGMLVEGRRATLLFDLGNAGAIDLYPRFWHSADFMKGRKTSTALSGGAGGTSEKRITLLKNLSIGGVEFNQIPSRLEETISDGEETLDGNIGIGVLSRFHLTVDFPHKRVLFEPPVDRTPFPINHVGLTTRREEGGWLILHVADKSPAALAGLAVGDIIVSLDGAPVDETKRANWQNGQVGTIVNLRLSSGREVRLTRAAYF
jgi:hypothetical protein